MGHHRRAHSTPEQAGEIASPLAPRPWLCTISYRTSPVEAWQRAAILFGELLIPPTVKCSPSTLNGK